MIEIAQEVAVDAPPDSVWPILRDPEAVVPCIPGAELTGRDGERFDARITVKFGPMRVAFAGAGTMAVDDDERSGALTGGGRDGRGATKVAASGEFRLEPTEDGTSVIVVRGTVTIGGALASVVERGAGAVVERLSKEFAQKLAERCAL